MNCVGIELNGLIFCILSLPVQDRFVFTTRKQSLGQGNMFTGVCMACAWSGGVHGPGGAWSRGGAWSQGLHGGDPRRLLLRAVRILLECILVKFKPVMQ